MIEVIGLEGVQQKLAKLEQHLSPAEMRQKLLTLGDMVKDSIEEAFERQSSPFGKAWKPLEINTIKYSYGGKKRTKSGKGTKRYLDHIANKRILYTTGALSERWSVSANASSVTVSGNATSKGYAYGAVHQFGSKNIPARPFLPIDESGDIEPRLLKSMDDYLSEEISGILSQGF